MWIISNVHEVFSINYLLVSIQFHFLKDSIQSYQTVKSKLNMHDIYIQNNIQQYDIEKYILYSRTPAFILLVNEMYNDVSVIYV